jgi:hypothetical protein
MKKLHKDWKQKTIEYLEGEKWIEPEHQSRLVIRTHELRKISLEKFTIEDVRIMIGQQFGLDYLIPLALEILDKNLFAKGDFFEGDLLKNVVEIDTVFWNKNKIYWQKLNNLIKNRRNEISRHKFDCTKFDNYTASLISDQL